MTLHLTAPRLRLRPITLDDVPELVRLNDDPIVHRFTGDGPVDAATAARIVTDVITPQYARGIGRLAVCAHTGPHAGAFLGWCGLKWHDMGACDGDHDGFYDLGYRFHVDARGHGYATEAAAAVLDDADVHLPFARILARIVPENAASLRVAHKLGFVLWREIDDDGRRLALFARPPRREGAGSASL
jgi:RimJ/RimL family protein N-acetyltransferase